MKASIGTKKAFGATDRTRTGDLLLGRETFYHCTTVASSFFNIVFNLLNRTVKVKYLERRTGFEPATFSLARRRSTNWTMPAHLCILLCCASVPSWGVEPQSHVFQTRAVTTLASLANAVILTSLIIGGRWGIRTPGLLCVKETR